MHYYLTPFNPLSVPESPLGPKSFLGLRRSYKEVPRRGAELLSAL